MAQEFKAKTKTQIGELDHDELITYVASMTAQVEHKDDEHKQAMDDKEKENKDAVDEKEEEAKKAKKAMEDEEHDKKEALKAAILKAMDEPDKDKREAMIKSAMDEEHKENKDAKKGMEEDEEKKALKAQVTYLASKIKEPQLDYLTKVYQAAKTPEKELNEYIADWNKKTPQQLDAEIKKTKNLAETVGIEFEATQEQKSPFGYRASTLPPQTKQFDASKAYKKIDEMTPEEAFSSGGPYN